MIQKWQGWLTTVPPLDAIWAMHCPDIYAVGFTKPVDVIWSIWTDEMLTRPESVSFILNGFSVTVPTGNPVLGSHPAFTVMWTFPVNPPSIRLGMCTCGAPDEDTIPIPLGRSKLQT
jgi:hypothetical protein